MATARVCFWAQMRSADRVRKCLLFGVDRTYGRLHESDAIDPLQTLSGATFNRCSESNPDIELRYQASDSAVHVARAHSHRLPLEGGAGTMSPSGAIPFRNLKRSLPVERKRVVFSPIIAL